MTAVVDTKCSFAQFVYPFLFDAETFPQRVHAFEKATHDAKPVWCDHEFSREDLMPHVSEYLSAASGKNADRATARIWKLNDDVSAKYGLDRDAKWTLSVPPSLDKSSQDKSDGYDIPYMMGRDNHGKLDVQLILFRVGVGMLTIQAAPKQDNTSVDDWLAFIHYFRFTTGRRYMTRGTERVAVLKNDRGNTPNATGGDRLLLEIFQELLTAGNPVEQWWRDVFVPGRALPFAALYVDDLPENEEAEMRYRLRHFFRREQQVALCADGKAREARESLTRTERQWFLFSLEGGAYLACDAKPGYFRDEMPLHLQGDYFTLFLLALHQRFALIGMSEQVAQHWPSGDSSDDAGREKVFNTIRNTLLAFTARGYFAQIMQRDNHHRCYCKWQEVFQLERLYGEVRDEVREMHEYLLMEQSLQQQRTVERYGRIFACAGLFFAVPTLFFAFLSINLSGFNITVRAAARDGLIVMAASVIVIALIFVIEAVVRKVQQPHPKK